MQNMFYFFRKSQDSDNKLKNKIDFRFYILRIFATNSVFKVMAKITSHFKLTSSSETVFFISIGVVGVVSKMIQFRKYHTLVITFIKNS